MTSQLTQPSITHLLVSVSLTTDDSSMVTINDRGVICDCDSFVYRKSFFICEHMKYVFQTMSNVPFNKETIDSYIKSVYPLISSYLDPEHIAVEQKSSSAPNTPSIFDGHDE